MKIKSLELLQRYYEYVLNSLNSDLCVGISLDIFSPINIPYLCDIGTLCPTPLILQEGKREEN